MIEDNRDAAESLRVLLRLFGHDVTVAHSGSQGVEWARRSPPDVILCDLSLPGMDGFGVARALRQEPATSKVWLFALSGFAGDEDRRRCLEAGFDRHLVKPVDGTELEQLLADLPPRDGGEEAIR